MKQRFDAKLVGRGPKGAWTFLPIPFNVQAAFGSKARVPVAGTLNGFAFRNSLLPNGDGTHSMAVNKELQAGANAKAGDTVAVVMAPDTAQRSVAIPEDLKTALCGTAQMEQAFAKLPYSARKEFVDWVIEAKKPETRTRRVERALQLLAAGKRPKG